MLIMSRKGLYSSRTQPSVFFGLPDPLKVCILDEWLELPNTEHTPSHRNQYISLMRDKRCELVLAVQPSALFKADLTRLFKSPGCVFQCLVRDENGDKLPWILANRIQVSNVSLTRRFIEDDSLRSKVLLHLAPTVQCLKLNLLSSFDVNKHDRIYNRPARRHHNHPLYNDYDYSEYSDYSEYESEEEEMSTEEKDTFQTNQILSEVFASLTNMRHFHLERNVKYAMTVELPDNYCELFTQCVHLESICLQSCVIRALILEAMCKAPSLRRVAFPGCSMPDTDTTVEGASESSVRYIETSNIAFCALFPQLEEVHLTKNTTDDVVALARACPNITTATITLTTPMEASHAHEICKHLNRLSVFMCSKMITDEAVIVFIKHCHALQYMCTDYTPTQPLHHTKPPLTHSPQYKRSQLRELHISADFTSDSVLQAIVTHCPLLHTLRLCDASKPILHSLHRINNSTVKHLHLKSCNNTTDYDIAPLRTIDTLHVTNYYGKYKQDSLTCNGVANMAKHCTTLCGLYFSNASSKLVSAVLGVLPVCPSLRVFSFDLGARCSYERNDGEVLVRMMQKMLREQYPDVKVLFPSTMK